MHDSTGITLNLCSNLQLTGGRKSCIFGENLTNDASLVFDNHGATENLHFLQDF